MPFIAGSRPAAAYLIGIILSELAAPFADRFIGDRDATGDHHLLDIAIAEGKTEVEPDGMRDDFWGKAMVFVALWVGGRRHVVVPQAVCNGSSESRWSAHYATSWQDSQ
jgi:hypothetical protein